VGEFVHRGGPSRGGGLPRRPAGWGVHLRCHDVCGRTCTVCVVGPGGGGALFWTRVENLSSIVVRRVGVSMSYDRMTSHAVSRGFDCGCGWAGFKFRA
jgi:hypothetical protein